MLDMRPDTNPVIMSHLSYLIPMPVFEAGVPGGAADRVVVSARRAVHGVHDEMGRPRRNRRFAAESKLRAVRLVAES